jgi:hypothetical protein
LATFAFFAALGLVRGEHFLLDQRHRAAGLFHCRLGAGRGMVHGELEARLQLALAQQAHAVQRAPDHAGVDERIRVHGLAGIQSPGIHGRLQAAEIDLVPLLAVELVEAAFRQAPMQRHLPALEAAEPCAGPRRLALAAAAAGLAHTGTDAPADAHAELARSGVVLELVEPHRRTLLDFGFRPCPRPRGQGGPPC